MNYFVTVSWPSEAQPLLREYYNTTIEIDNISDMDAYDIVNLVKQQESFTRYKSDFVINFIMPLGATK